MVSGILATDMTHHFTMIKEVQALKQKVSAESSEGLSPNFKEHELLINIIFHAADLSNPCLPNFDTVKSWALKICEEFTAQQVKEEAAGLPFAPFMKGLDNEKAVAKLQVGFLDYVISPLWKAVAELLPKLDVAYKALRANRDKWEAITKAED